MSYESSLWALKIILEAMWEKAAGSAGFRGSEGGILDSLDLAHPGRWTALGAWERELRQLKTLPEVPSLFLRPTGVALPCPQCRYVFDERGKVWFGTPRYLGRNRFAQHKVESVFSKVCGFCGGQVPKDDFRSHQTACRPEDPLTLTREPEVAAVLFSYWEYTAKFSSPDLYPLLVGEVVKSCAPPGRRVGFTLKEILQLAKPGEVEITLPVISAVVKNCPNLQSSRRMQHTFVRLLGWLGHEVARAADRGSLSPKEVAERECLLAIAFCEARMVEVLVRDDGTCHTRVPHLEGRLLKYFGNASRIALLEHLAQLSSGREMPECHRSLSWGVGLSLLTPVFVTSFLALELFLPLGTLSDSILGCTLGDFERRTVHQFGKSKKGGLLAEPGVQWYVSGELLVADARLGRALENYLRYVRHRLVPACPPGPRARQPLFPAWGGAPMSSLVRSLRVFFAMSGGKLDGVVPTQDSLEKLRDEIAKEDV